MSDNILSYSVTALIVYGISCIFFFIVVWYLNWDQIKEFVERDLSFESIEKANEKRGLDLTQLKSKRNNKLYDCDNYSSETV